MESKAGWSTIFNIISYLMLGGFIALAVLAVLEYIDSESYLNYKVYGSAACIVLFVAMRILLNIAKNVRIVADNTYDMLVLIERYVKAADINTECLSKKDLKKFVKQKKILNKMEKKKEVLSDVVVESEAVVEPKPKGKTAINLTNLNEKYSFEDWKKNLDGRIVCKKCGSPVTVLNSNVGIPVLYCSKAAAKAGCDNKYITVTSFAGQFLKWFNLAFDKRMTDFDFEELNKSAGKIVFGDGSIAITGRDSISYSPNGSNKKKGSIDL